MTDPSPPSPPLLPLSGLVVLDLTLARAGPTAVRHLADWGADVIRIESPPPVKGSGADEDVVGATHGPDYQNLHRNKRSMRLNLKTPEGHAAFMKLVATADVLVENMRASVKDRLKIAWDDVHAVNPRLVYGSLSGFGQTGPYRERAGVDQIAQGMSGLMSVTGAPGGGPMRVGIAVADLTAGNLLALAIMTALFERHRTGLGRWVHTSLLEAQIFMLDFQASRWLMAGEIAGQAGNDHPMGIPTGVFETSDGFINIAASSARMWERLCDAMGQPAWKAREEWRTQKGRSRDRVQINAAIGAVTRLMPAAHWIESLSAAGVPCGPIYAINQVFDDPQVKGLGITQPVMHPKLGPIEIVASPLNIEGVSKEVRSPTPRPWHAYGRNPVFPGLRCAGDSGPARQGRCLNPLDITPEDALVLEQQARRAEIPLGDGHMVWRGWGQGEDVVVLLHGGAGSWVHWVRNIQALTPRYTVWVPDFPGMGDSALPPEPWTPQSMADIVQTAWRNSWASGAAIWWDFPFGAMIGGHLAAQYPQRVRQLVIASAAGTGLSRDPGHLMQPWRGVPDPARRREIHRGNLGKWMLHDPDNADALAVAVLPVAIEADRLRNRQASRTDTLLRVLPQVICPVHGIWGDQDVMFRHARVELAAALKAAGVASLQFIPGAGHWVQYEKALEFNAALLALLQQKDGAT